MFYSKVAEDKYLIRLKKGEEINKSLKKFCQKEGIINGSFSGIGSLEEVTLAHYLVGSKKYSEKKLKGVFEVAPLTGNIALFEEEPLVHSHILISDEQMRAFAGHLVEAKVSATLEIVLIKFDSKFTKSFDNSIGLKLYDLDCEI